MWLGLDGCCGKWIYLLHLSGQSRRSAAAETLHCLHEDRPSCMEISISPVTQVDWATWSCLLSSKATVSLQMELVTHGGLCCFVLMSASGASVGRIRSVDLICSTLQTVNIGLNVDASTRSYEDNDPIRFVSVVSCIRRWFICMRQRCAIADKALHIPSACGTLRTLCAYLESVISRRLG